mgnify:CR=1 FL=1
MTKKTKTKNTLDTQLEVSKNLTETMSVIDDMLKNMETLNDNMQGAIDHIEELDKVVQRMRDRMGLW